ncbi:MAG: hypothetical protein IKZ51_03325 [Bacteroidales bacterium]|nr:hypothetical protein [Bacteroidales bacterium]
MDVEFLSGMIGELMLDHDSLSLPGLGTFVAEDMPASFSDRGYTINPPYRRLSFTGKLSDDSLLQDLYAGSNPQAPEEAVAVLNQFLQDLKDELLRQKSVDLPGLGRLRATRENHFFFVADESLDISPEACGLSPVSLKTHNAALATLTGIAALASAGTAGNKTADNVSEREEKQANGRKTAENVSESAETSVRRPATGAPARDAKAPAAKPRKLSKPVIWALGIVAAAVLFLAGFFALSRIAPDFTDKILYTPEELEILNYPEDGLGLPG